MNHSERLQRAKAAAHEAVIRYAFDGERPPKVVLGDIREEQIAVTLEAGIAAYLGDETVYVIDSCLNDWDAIGAIDSTGESIGTLVPLNVEDAELGDNK